MTICSFDTPAFIRKSGILSHKHSHTKNYSRKCDFSWLAYVIKKIKKNYVVIKYDILGLIQ